MFMNMQQVTAEVYLATKHTTDYDWEGHRSRAVWYNLHMFLGVYPNWVSRPMGITSLSNRKRARASNFLRGIMRFLWTPRHRNDRTILWCGSDAIQWMEPDERVPPEMTPEEVPYQRIEDRFPFLIETHWIFYIPGAALNNIVKGAFWFLDKEATADENGDIPDIPFQVSEATGLPDYCFGSDTVDIEPNEGEGIPADIFVICENFWDIERYNSEEPPPLEVNTRPQPDDALLVGVMPLWQTLYEVLLELAFRHTGDPNSGPIMVHQEWPLTPADFTSFRFKSNWRTLMGYAYKPYECILLRMWDQALPVQDNLNDFGGINSVTNYGWYSVAVYLAMRRPTQTWDYGFPFCVNFVEIDEDFELPPGDVRDGISEKFLNGSVGHGSDSDLPDSVYLSLPDLADLQMDCPDGDGVDEMASKSEGSQGGAVFHEL